MKGRMKRDRKIGNNEESCCIMSEKETVKDSEKMTKSEFIVNMMFVCESYVCWPARCLHNEKQRAIYKARIRLPKVPTTADCRRQVNLSVVGEASLPRSRPERKARAKQVTAQNAGKSYVLYHFFILMKCLNSCTHNFLLLPPSEKIL